MDQGLKTREDRARRVARRAGFRLRVEQRRWHREHYGRTYALLGDNGTVQSYDASYRGSSLPLSEIESLLAINASLTDHPRLSDSSA